DAGSLVEDVIVDGTSVGAVASYTFTNVTATHTLTASFVDGNHPPTLSVPDTLTANEGALVAFSAVATDPESAVQPLTFSLVPPSPANATVDGSTGQVQWTPVDNGSATIRVRVSDGFSATEADVRVGVLNVAPTASIVSPAAGALYALGDAVAFTGTYADAGAADTHTARWIVDGQTLTAVVNAATHTVSASWSAPAPGVYSVRLVVTDDDGGEGQATQVDGFDAMVVVYDPAGGFATGGGWFKSPAGAYRADTTLTGKASFGFVSKYARGASVPTGETEFQFKAANFRFQSSAYEWLVVSGARAQYHGTGSVNGVAGYKFTLTATDGDLIGGLEVDRLRIRIWSVASGGVAYDNQHGDSDSADPVTALGGGSIVIHKPPGGNGRGTEPAGVQALPVVFAVHAPTPNPSRAGAALVLDLPEEAEVTATVVDVTGREVEQLHRGVLPAGRHQIRWTAADRTGRRVAAGMYFVRVTSVRAGSPRQSAVRKVIMQ
ncbi:MAG: FlgD immunoglobulin-like domain containing protein, partial [Candidatus Eisenbacteria bacterium]